MEAGCLMGCCSPNYRKTVNEEEERINEKGSDTLPFSLKILLIAAAAVSLIFIILI
ncbi:hypothetical protein [Bacillus sp. P14.5]|uniref:hypothetical protein n=1 Tax=Bacillus sp. P14.5 TaxID=1983400 RepID=UPI0013B04FFC|nr:hypothetical protein [Bacillus sp. P14.5]